MTATTAVLHSVSSLDAADGGPPLSVSRLCRELADLEGMSVSLVSQIETGRATISPGSPKVKLFLGEAERRGILRLPFRRALARAMSASAPSILHDHGIWLPPNHYVATLARRRGIPLVIHPRGMLEPWALAHRGWKKRLALRLYQRRNLELAALFFVTAEQELESLRALGLKQPVAIVPNGVDLPPPHVGERDTRLPRNLVFLGRIHPKKGLLDLVEALSRVRPSDWRLRFAGPDEGGHLAEVMRRVEVRGLRDSVEYVGVVEGATKTALFAGADLFVLPSHSENFGLVVAEALAHGVPVITTRATPWKGLEQRGCGWWIEPTADALAECFRAAFALDPTALRAMGAKGREYAREFHWPTIARQTADVYRWVLGRGSKPGCVVD